MEQNSIALDGPAGAGKSTLAKMAAKHFGYIYVDTGAMYRCIGLYALRNRAASKDEKAVAALLPEIRLEMRYAEDGLQRMILNGEDVTDAIRSPEVSMYASDVSAMMPVRGYLLSMQREMAEKYDVIMDGRDIGTVILPNAGLKVFLTADPKVRAKWRHLELLGKKIEAAYEDVLSEMNLRDKNDSERALAPLKAADGSVMLDTTHLDLQESFSALCSIIQQRYGSTEGRPAI